MNLGRLASIFIMGLGSICNAQQSEQLPRWQNNIKGLIGWSVALEREEGAKTPRARLYCESMEGRPSIPIVLALVPVVVTEPESTGKERAAWLENLATQSAELMNDKRDTTLALFRAFQKALVQQYPLQQWRSLLKAQTDQAKETGANARDVEDFWLRCGKMEAPISDIPPKLLLKLDDGRFLVGVGGDIEPERFYLIRSEGVRFEFSRWSTEKKDWVVVTEEEWKVQYLKKGEQNITTPGGSVVRVRHCP